MDTLAQEGIQFTETERRRLRELWSSDMNNGFGNHHENHDGNNNLVNHDGNNNNEEPLRALLVLLQVPYVDEYVQILMNNELVMRFTHQNLVVGERFTGEDLIMAVDPIDLFINNQDPLGMNHPLGMDQDFVNGPHFNPNFVYRQKIRVKKARLERRVSLLRKSFVHLCGCLKRDLRFVKRLIEPRKVGVPEHSGDMRSHQFGLFSSNGRIGRERKVGLLHGIGHTDVSAEAIVLGSAPPYLQHSEPFWRLLLASAASVDPKKFSVSHGNFSHRNDAERGAVYSHPSLEHFWKTAPNSLKKLPAFWKAVYNAGKGRFERIREDGSTTLMDNGQGEVDEFKGEVLDKDYWSGLRFERSLVDFYFLWTHAPEALKRQPKFRKRAVRALKTSSKGSKVSKGLKKY